MAEKLPSFLLTENLNRLAKWLRLLGFDAALYKSISFQNMKRLAVNDRRIILTRDKNHIRKASKDVILIRSTDHLEQLRELKDKLILRKENLFRRCILCNKLLYGIDKENIKELVPEYVYQNHTEFRVCRKCGKIYWQGTHYKNMLKNLSEIFNKE